MVPKHQKQPTSNFTIAITMAKLPVVPTESAACLTILNFELEIIWSQNIRNNQLQTSQLQSLWQSCQSSPLKFCCMCLTIWNFQLESCVRLQGVLGLFFPCQVKKFQCGFAAAPPTVFQEGFSLIPIPMIPQGLSIAIQIVSSHHLIISLKNGYY